MTARLRFQQFLTSKFFTLGADLL